MSDGNKPVVLVTNKNITKAAIELLSMVCKVKYCKNFPVTTNDILDNRGMDAILWADCTKLNKEILDAAGDSLKVIAITDTELDFVDLNEIKSRKILLGYSKIVVDENTANLAVGLLLCVMRRIFEGQRKVFRNEVAHSSYNFLHGYEIRHSIVGLVGFDKTGQIIARRLQHFEPKKIVYYSLEGEILHKYGAEKVHFVELLRSSDSIIITISLSIETEHLFDADAFNVMKPNCVLINVSRRAIVDEKALYNALKAKKIFGAAADFCNLEPITHYDRLLTLENCVITPNLRQAEKHVIDNKAIIAAHNILRGLAGDPLFATPL